MVLMFHIIYVWVSTPQSHACSTLNRHEKKYGLALVLLSLSLFRSFPFWFAYLTVQNCTWNATESYKPLDAKWNVNKRNAFQYVYLVESRFFTFTTIPAKAGFSYFCNQFQFLLLFLFSTLSLSLSVRSFSVRWYGSVEFGSLQRFA